MPKDKHDLAVQTVSHARAASSQIMDVAYKAQQMAKTINQSNPMAAGLTDVQERAMRVTQRNIDASFLFATELARAKDLKEAWQIQCRYAQSQMDAYALQAMEFGVSVKPTQDKEL